MSTNDAEMDAIYESTVNEVKHRYLYLSLHPSWITLRPTIRVNKLLQCSFDGGPWHGTAHYTVTEEGGRWELKFHYKAEVDKMKTLVFEELHGTTSFLHLNKENKGYNAMLIPSLSE